MDETLTQGQFIFANNTYSKPYFVTYVNTAFFAIAFLPIVIRRLYQNGGVIPVRISALWKRQAPEYSQVPAEEECQPPKLSIENNSPRSSCSPANRLLCEDEMGRPKSMTRDFETPREDALTWRETVKLSLEFCVIWVSDSLEPVRYEKLTYSKVCSTCESCSKIGAVKN